jgi:phage tail-like protein
VAEQTPEAAPGKWVDPHPAYNFKVVIKGQTIAHFLECGGIGASIGTMEYREGGQLQVVHQIPTITTYNDVTLS